MKRLIMVAMLLLLGYSVASAQNKGDKYFGGQIGVTIQSVASGGYSESAAAFSIEPEFGCFVADKFKVGVSVGYAVSGGVHAFTVCPNIAYYVRLCDGMYYTPGLYLGFAMAATDGLTMPGFGVGLHALSLEFRPTPHFGFAVNLLSFNAVVLNSSEYNVSSTSLNCNIGLNPTIGFKYYF